MERKYRLALNVGAQQFIMATNNKEEILRFSKLEKLSDTDMLQYLKRVDDEAYGTGIPGDGKPADALSKGRVGNAVAPAPVEKEVAPGQTSLLDAAGATGGAANAD